MNITLNQLRAFVAVARERSFTRAAEALATSQPSISLLIKQLETALGLKLFDRTTKELHLTAEAANFLPTIERLNEDLDAALQDLLATAERRRGRVSLAVLHSIATNVLPDTVASFAAKYPNIRISVRDDNTKAICQQVRNGEVDLGVAGHVDGDADLMFEPLLPIPNMNWRRPPDLSPGLNWQRISSFPSVWIQDCARCLKPSGSGRKISGSP
ncbi:MAG: LysR family transcriptional regulator [Rhodobacteraceae bacterium]|nr:LysR family transcriptional regulator [Paracoccaceae bacterium]